MEDIYHIYPVPPPPHPIPDPHSGIRLSRLMLLKLQFLDRGAAGSNDHVQMANDYQILHLKPDGSVLRVYFVMLPYKYFFEIGDTLDTHAAFKKVRCLRTCWTSSAFFRDLSSSSSSLHISGAPADSEATSSGLLRTPEYMRASCTI